LTDNLGAVARAPRRLGIVIAYLWKPQRKEVNSMPTMHKLLTSLKDPSFATMYRKNPVKAVEGGLGRSLTTSERDAVRSLKLEHLHKIVKALHPRVAGTRARPD
jgi:hypothetical protein